MFFTSPALTGGFFITSVIWEAILAYSQRSVLCLLDKHRKNENEAAEVANGNIFCSVLNHCISIVAILKA